MVLILIDVFRIQLYLITKLLFRNNKLCFFFVATADSNEEKCLTTLLCVYVYHGSVTYIINNTIYIVKFLHRFHMITFEIIEMLNVILRKMFSGMKSRTRNFSINTFDSSCSWQKFRPTCHYLCSSI